MGNGVREWLWEKRGFGKCWVEGKWLCGKEFYGGHWEVDIKIEKEQEKWREDGERERRLREAEIQFKQMKSDELCRLSEKIENKMKIRRKLSSKLDIKKHWVEKICLKKGRER